MHYVLSMETTNFEMRRKIKNTLQSFLFFYFSDDANIANLCNKYFSWIYIRVVHISMGKFQSGFLKKHIIFPGCILLPENKYVRVEHFDPGK